MPKDGDTSFAHWPRGLGQSLPGPGRSVVLKGGVIMGQKNEPPKTTHKPLGIRQYPAPTTRLERGRAGKRKGPSGSPGFKTPPQTKKK